MASALRGLRRACARSRRRRRRRRPAALAAAPTRSSSRSADAGGRTRPTSGAPVGRVDLKRNVGLRTPAGESLDRRRPTDPSATRSSRCGGPTGGERRERARHRIALPEHTQRRRSTSEQTHRVSTGAAGYTRHAPPQTAPLPHSRADLLGLLLAFLDGAAAVPDRRPGGRPRRLAARGLGLLHADAAVWVVAAKVYGLYDRDEERTDHSTIDDVVGVFHLVTVGSLLMFARHSTDELASTRSSPADLVLGARRSCAIPLGARDRTRHRRRQRRLPAEHDHRRRRRHRPASSRASCCGTRVRDQARRLRRRARRRTARDDLEQLTILGDAHELPRDRPAARRRAVIVAFSDERHERDARAHPRAQGARRPDRHRPAPLRRRRPGRRHPHVEGLPLIGLPLLRLVVLVAAPQADDRRRRRGLGLLLLAPLFAVVALRDQARLAGPGLLPADADRRGGRPFRIFKFRTMVDDADERKAEVVHLNKHLASGDPRMFKIPTTRA